QSGVGIPIIYLVQLGMYHWLTAAVDMLPWYLPRHNPFVLAIGFQQSVYAILSFGIGSLIFAPLITGLWRNERGFSPRNKTVTIKKNESLHIPWPQVYFYVGIIGFFFITPLTSRLPTISAFFSAMGDLMIVGGILLCWLAIRTNNKKRLLGYLILFALLPVFTTVSSGFLGWGFSFFLLVLIFILRANKRPIGILVIVMLIAYLSVSVFVNYMEARDDIRASVWGGESLRDRLFTTAESFQNFELFDIYNNDHLRWFEARLDQNIFIGMAIERLDNGIVEVANGKTLGDAATMLIPRILWPNKPVRLGGAQIISYYTGIPIYGSTTSPTGHVLELYINFKTLGVIIGFVFIGTLLTIMDEQAAKRLYDQDFSSFAVWFLPALSLLHPDNNFMVFTAGSISALIFILVFNRFVQILYIPKKSTFRVRKQNKSSHKG
ncbi:MAG: hypothetical protein IAF02_21380, partial [Anaerolineae bacterium]|nr:hypothetical protein [Anaerolineae bacterium]